MKPEIKKLLILNLPYLLFVWLFDKVGAAVRLSLGADASAKLLHLGDGFTAAFSSIAPSFHPVDLLIGIAGAVIVRLIIYVKGKNAKKYRKGMEYGSARWGTAEDIKPYTDPVFENNIPPHTDGTAHHEQPPEAAKVCKEQKYPCNRRFRQRQDKVFCQTVAHANAQQLCCHRPERHRLNRVREALTAGRLSDKSAEYD